MLSGADTIEEVSRIRDETIQLLRRGSFELSKWASNCRKLLEAVDNRNGEVVSIDDQSNSSILGIQWNQISDTFHFSCKLNTTPGIVSKRVILSEVSRLFDPLGLLGPVIVTAKLILQELWQSGVHWDESVPQDIHSHCWSKLRSQLFDINQLQISRCVKSNSNSTVIQVHGFCDASQRAYGACVYIRVELGLGKYQSELLCSRSRVAPLKAVSLPKLELCTAVLLARLIAKVEESLSFARIQTFLWSDSTITLNWITSSSRKWAVFVANRVGEIQRLTDHGSWRHISSSNNPADILSRGVSPMELIAESKWWHGPGFLQLDDNLWPSSSFVHMGEDKERRKTIAVASVIGECIVSKLTSKFSNLNKISRIVAYCLRFRTNRRPDEPIRLVSPDEKSLALSIMCRAVQKRTFVDEYRALNGGSNISLSSNLLSLSPFMDEAGLMRVGGRLKNANISFDSCHPILLPRSDNLTRLIIEHEHVRNLHAGTQATMAAVRQRYWPLAIRSTTQKIVQNCITCFKAKPRQSEAVMGSLPASRVTISRPFSRCGIDYAGPVILREGKRRNSRNHKAYIAIFVCFTTEAVHVELVSDLTTEAFLGAFRRFISQRGRPAHMFSDNGTIVGAQNRLSEFYKIYNEQQIQSDIKRFFYDQEISWSFILPNTPHFGGLWEAAVKSAKFHMARIIGNAHLTFEEMQTSLCKIEAILNSRPITPLSSDPNDLEYITSGHFLVGTTLNSFPYSDLSNVPENRLVRWQRVEQLRQHFWERWSTEYLHSLQERTKWRSSKGAQLSPNQMVLVRQQNLAPMQWVLGRVQETHPGSDGVARTATIKTAKGVFVRPLSRLAILPIDN
ncbi:uncharacterized protein LOC105207218 [Solenopsis invicta]|uniref:uncharacterized protein LOC105207218 n=1 Tax=Solenopsis invicta TaxID=13686 RepID=UPI00193CE87E|nr:uncharacterized protein LOC105207218 [Solenopsis invicta]